MDHDDLTREISMLLEITKNHTSDIQDHETRIRNVEVLMYKIIGAAGAVSLAAQAIWQFFKVISK